jgi:hypothetical protein
MDQDSGQLIYLETQKIYHLFPRHLLIAPGTVSRDLKMKHIAKTYDGEKAASSTNVAGKTGYLPAEN